MEVLRPKKKHGVAWLLIHPYIISFVSHMTFAPSTWWPNMELPATALLDARDRSQGVSHLPGEVRGPSTQRWIWFIVAGAVGRGLCVKANFLFVFVFFCPCWGGVGWGVVITFMYACWATSCYVDVTFLRSCTARCATLLYSVLALLHSYAVLRWCNLLARLRNYAVLRWCSVL